MWFSSSSSSWAKITLISLLFALITSMASAILSRGKDCEVPKLVGKWSEFGSEFRSELELELGGGPAHPFSGSEKFRFGLRGWGGCTRFQILMIFYLVFYHD